MITWTVVPAAPEHIPAIARDMREADRREIWASHRHTPEEALEYALERSDLAWTCLLSAPAAGADASPVDGTPTFMWGAARLGSIITLKGSPWLLGTDAIRKVQLEFLRQCPAFVERMNRRFPRLENFVHAENALSIRWLKWCGFTLEEEAPEVINGEDFFQFWRDA
jgi:hypothetical protein